MTLRRSFMMFAVAALTIGGYGGCSDDAAPTPTAPATPTVVPPSPTGAGQPTPTIPSPDNPIVIIFGDGEPDVGEAPLTVHFTVSDPFMRFDDPQFHWEFGDGTPPSDKRSPTHTYDRPGKYTAYIKVTDVGDWDDDTVEILVKEPKPPPSGNADKTE